MLTLTGIVSRVSNTKESKNKETGEVIPGVPVVYIQHTSNSDPDSELELLKIKVKTSIQVEAFRRALNKQIRIDVRTWQSGDKSGFWLETGVLPTVVQEAQPQVALPKAA
jgi:hypothetical protein